MKKILILVLLAFITNMTDASPIEDIKAAAKSLDSSERGTQVISLSNGMNVSMGNNTIFASQKIGGMEYSSTSKIMNLTDGLQSSVS